jgi:hypothetical protein
MSYLLVLQFDPSCASPAERDLHFYVEQTSRDRQGVDHGTGGERL